MPNASTMARLQRWYQSCCNGSWEQELGINVETLDNPGWSVTVDLEGTPLEKTRFPKRSEARSETDWIECRVAAAQFQGFGGVNNLEELLTVFLDWAESA